MRPLATHGESDDTNSSILSEFSNVSDRMNLLSGLRFLRMVARQKKTVGQFEKFIADFNATEQFVIWIVQNKLYPEKYDNLRQGKAVSASSSLSSLHPFIGECNLLVRILGKDRQVRPHCKREASGHHLEEVSRCHLACPPFAFENPSSGRSKD